MLFRTAGAPLLFGLLAVSGLAHAQYYPAYPGYPPHAQQLPVIPADDADDPFYDPPVVQSRPLPPPPGAVPPGQHDEEATPRVPGYIAREVPPGGAYPAYPPPAVAPVGPDGVRPPMPVGPTLSGEGAPAATAHGDARFASLPPDVRPETGPAKTLPPRFQRTMVDYKTKEPAGTIVIDTSNTYLYLVLGGGKAMRYGVGVGREGFTWSGTQKITRMAEWPDWTPPEEMIERQPYLPRFMAGGETNPLGARAMYLGSTVYRIHGTNQPSTIGTFVSSGCIRLTNADVMDLFSRVKVGTRVVVLPGHAPANPHAILPQAAAAAPPPGPVPAGAVPPAPVPGGAASIAITPLPPPPSALAR